MKAFLLKAGCVGLSMLGLIGANSASATLVSSFDFNSDMSDTLGNHADILGLGGNLITPGRYTFGMGEGLRLDNFVGDTSTYGIKIRFEMDFVGSQYKKLIDFQNLLADHGTYVLNNNLHFYTAGGSGTAIITSNTDMIVTVVRDGTTGQVTGALDGVVQWSFNDAGNQAVSVPNILHFFIDDAASGSVENFAGSVDYIRIYDTADTQGDPPPPPVPLPMTGLLLASGSGVMAFKRRCR